MKKLAALKQELLSDPSVARAYEELAGEFEVARELIAARARAGLTQSDVAERMGTSQSVIARLEGGARMPSMRTVQRYAEALGAKAVIRIETAERPSARRAAHKA